jgi:DNA invertase Pin-like site-specific DNA recombinase
MADIFVSYTGSDQDWTFWLALELKALGHTPRIHEWEIEGGEDIPRWMQTRLQAVDKGAGFRSLGDTWADATTPRDRPMFAVLGGLAEFEGELIRARTTEGRRWAVARGRKLGRKPKLTPHQVKEAIRRRNVGDETVRDIARSYNVNHSMISRLGA